MNFSKRKHKQTIPISNLPLRSPLPHPLPARAVPSLTQLFSLASLASFTLWLSEFVFFSLVVYLFSASEIRKILKANANKTNKWVEGSMGGEGKAKGLGEGNSRNRPNLYSGDLCSPHLQTVHLCASVLVIIIIIIMIIIIIIVVIVNVSLRSLPPPPLPSTAAVANFENYNLIWMSLKFRAAWALPPSSSLSVSLSLTFSFILSILMSVSRSCTLLCLIARNVFIETITLKLISFH